MRVADSLEQSASWGQEYRIPASYWTASAEPRKPSKTALKPARSATMMRVIIANAVKA